MPTSDTAGLLRTSKGPAVVLCSRGFSFERRLERVVEYARRSGVRNILLLHCPERRWSEPLAREVSQRAGRLFDELNGRQHDLEEDELTFELLLCKGTLQDNLEALLRNNAEDIMVVFVGAKMLDYRLEDIKKLNTALFFLND